MMKRAAIVAGGLAIVGAALWLSPSTTPPASRPPAAPMVPYKVPSSRDVFMYGHEQSMQFWDRRGLPRPRPLPPKKTEPKKTAPRIAVDARTA